MRIGICDDEYSEGKRIEECLLAFRKDLTITRCESGEELIRQARKAPALDLVFLDIYLEKENGMDIARRLREISPEMEIVFCTSSREYALEAFSVRAADYLVKPVTVGAVREVFERLRNKGPLRRILSVRVGHETVNLYQDEILRVESSRHETLLILGDGRLYEARAKYGDICARLDECFLEVRRGVSVNMEGIERISLQEVAMRDGTVYGLSRMRRGEIMDRYNEYILEKRSENAWD